MDRIISCLFGLCKMVYTRVYTSMIINQSENNIESVKGKVGVEEKENKVSVKSASKLVMIFHMHLPKLIIIKLKYH